MKRLLILILLFVGTNISAKEWVEKHIIIIDNRYVPETILTLQCIDSLNCYAFTDYATPDEQYTRIYYSKDQGNTWEKIYEVDYSTGEPYANVRYCQAVDTNNIFLTYGRSFGEYLYRVDKSTDGGKTFNKINFESPNVELYGGITELKMYDQKTGIIVTDPALIYTFDGWETYHINDLNGLSIREYALFFIDSEKICLAQRINWIGHFYSFNLKTEKWDEYSPPNYEPGTTDEIIMYDVSFINDSTGFACGGNQYGQGSYSSDVIWKTTTRGENWNIIYNETLPETWATTRISFSDELHGIAVGSWGKIMQTTDGGETWFYHTDVRERIRKSSGLRVAMAGEYPILAATAGGIYRYEEPVSVNETEFKDANFEIRQTPENFTINITDDNHRKFSLQIVDISGKTVYEGSLLYSLENVVGLSGFVQGGYVYRILCGNALVMSGKFAIIR